MARKLTGEEWLILIGGMLAGTWAIAELLTPRAPCPRCRTQLKEGTTPCPHCGLPLRWQKAPPPGLVG